VTTGKYLENVDIGNLFDIDLDPDTPPGDLERPVPKTVVSDLDLSRVKSRQYRAQWRFIIDCPASFSNKAFYYNHYMGTDDVAKPSRWSRFISQIMATKLSRKEAKETLPQIRELLPLNTKLVDIHSLLNQYNAPLARSLFDVSIVFDAAPHDLKTYIVVCFGVLPKGLQDFLDTREKVA
jgi:hypothetical protein